MSIKKAYNSWAKIYDTNKNNTRDLDKFATQSILDKYTFDTVLELGCGTGKNTEWLIHKAKHITAIDFSKEMLRIAKSKINEEKVIFKNADITTKWELQNDFYDLITTNLVLEHIENLNFIFENAYQKLKENGLFFVCELHPFKQYSGTKARYESENGIQELEVYTHHISEFTGVAKQNNFNLLELNEWFDDKEKQSIPRLISFVFKKESSK